MPMQQMHTRPPDPEETARLRFLNQKSTGAQLQEHDVHAEPFPTRHLLEHEFRQPIDRAVL